jgi:hypothetical protein
MKLKMFQSKETGCYAGLLRLVKGTECKFKTRMLKSNVLYVITRYSYSNLVTGTLKWRSSSVEVAANCYGRGMTVAGWIQSEAYSITGTSLTMLTILLLACPVPTQGSPLTAVYHHCVARRWRIPRWVATPLASAGSARSCLANG